MADFLTERTKFYCVAAPAVNFSISMSGKVTHRGAKVLTTAAKLSGKGLCPKLTAFMQSPQQCQFKQTPWLNFDLKCKAESKNLLMADSFCSCPVPICAGTVVKVRLARAQGFKQA